MPPNQRRVGLAVIVVGAVVGAVVGLVTEGVGLAVFEAVVFLGGGALAYRHGPIAKPPSPDIVVRPPVGQSQAARARRRNERIGVLAMGMPLVALLSLAAVVAPGTGPRLAFAGAALAVLILYARAFWLVGRGTLASDRRRLQAYDRQIQRLSEDQRWYEENVDPVAQRRRLARAGKVFAGLMVAPMLALVLILPALLTEESTPSVRLAGGIGSGVLLTLALIGACVWIVRARRHRPPAD